MIDDLVVIYYVANLLSEEFLINWQETSDFRGTAEAIDSLSTYCCMSV